MKRNIFTLLAVLLMTVMLQGCGSTKGYSGGKLQNSELARIAKNIKLSGIPIN